MPAEDNSLFFMDAAGGKCCLSKGHGEVTLSVPWERGQPAHFKAGQNQKALIEDLYSGEDCRPAGEITNHRKRKFDRERVQRSQAKNALQPVGPT